MIILVIGINIRWFYNYTQYIVDTAYTSFTVRVFNGCKISVDYVRPYALFVFTDMIFLSSWVKHTADTVQYPYLIDCSASSSILEGLICTLYFPTEMCRKWKMAWLVFIWCIWLSCSCTRLWNISSIKSWRGIIITGHFFKVQKPL